MPSFYDIMRARGGKDDFAVEKGLSEKESELRAGSTVEIKIDRYSPWEGGDRVDIHSNGVYFLDRRDHTFSPVVIKSTVRILHRLGFTGHFDIKIHGDKITVHPLQINRENNETSRNMSVANITSLDDIDDKSLWKQALANPVPLFKTKEGDPLEAIFDDKGFYLSPEAYEIYRKIKSEPHLYTVRAESGNYFYFGISTQPGGRWKRSHAYHLGTLAYELLGAIRYDDQDHGHWIEAWFDKDSFENVLPKSLYFIRMKERILISFYTPEFPVIKRDLERAESKLISIALSKGLNVLNRKKTAKEKRESVKLSRKKRALFLIPCCSSKSKGGEYPPWNDVHRDQKFNKFQFLDDYRLQLIRFYTSLSPNDAFVYFRNRGTTEEVRRKNAEKAWETNLKILESKTMPAINRYQGHLYRSININLIDQFKKNQIANVFIVSALLGLIAPTDLIPDYELMMSDKTSENKKVWRFWKNTFAVADLEQIINKLFSGFDYIYCLLSTTTGYLDSIIELLFNHASFVIKSSETGSGPISRSWGRVLTEVLSSQVSSPGDVEKITNENNCKMIDLNLFKNRGLL